jgi:3-methyladenine DNA glycosylase AlkD
MMPGEYTAIKKILEANSSQQALAAHRKFVPGTEEKMLGVRMPVLNGLAVQFKDGGFELVEKLWKAGSLEEKTLAAKILGKIARKDPERSLHMVRLLARDIGNWVVCDTIGMQSLKQIVNTHQKEIFDLAREFNHSRDPWQRRLSLVLVEWYTRDRRLHPEIKKLVKALEKDEAYYVKKAIVWINKNFEKGK